jgi:hypothetical protein
MTNDYSYNLLWLIFGYVTGYILIYFHKLWKNWDVKQTFKELCCVNKGHQLFATDDFLEIAKRFMGASGRDFPIKEITICKRCDKVLSFKTKIRGKHDL